MKVSLSWLKRFVDFEYSPSELADKLTMRGFESEVVADFSALEHIVVGEVKSAKKHPDADKLKVCTVTDGNETYNVVCGAPNVDKGQKIVFAKVGAVLPGDFKIGKAKIRGAESFGMICSERELGISEEHDGIMVLDSSCTVGAKIDTVLGETYDAIDVEVTPDKAFALSHRGIAREIAAMSGSKLKNPIEALKATSQSNDVVKVILDKKGGCTRYIAGTMKNLTVGPSPKWLADYLKSVGQKSINNLVDISNFMLLEIGHPTHIFDLKKLSKPMIEVKWAKKGEKFDALDEESYKLDTDHLIITDSVNTIALAGIIGGKDSAVSDTTTEVLIESAYFDPVVVRKGSKKLKVGDKVKLPNNICINVKKKGEYFHLKLNKIREKYPKTIEEIRGSGLMIGLKMVIDNTEFMKKLMDHKMLTVKAEENVIRLFPPLIVRNSELDEAIHIIETVCKEIN